MSPSKFIRQIAIIAAAATFSYVAQAELTLSQTPLLTQSGTVMPNLLFILDDSGSMDAQYLYQYGGTGGGYGLPGPSGNGYGVSTPKANCSGTLNIDTTCTYTPVSVAPPQTRTTPSSWTAQYYSQNTYVLGSDNNVYQCVDSGGCGSTYNPASPPAAPANWTAQWYGTYSVVTYTPNGHVYQCISSRNCPSDRVPSISTRWDDLGTVAEYIESINPWSSPGIALATFLANGTEATGKIWTLSPDVNRLSYDPRVRYKTRLTGVSGITTTAATPDTTTSFYVFFYGNGGSVTPKKSQVWNGTNTYGDPTYYSSYFAPYTYAAQSTNTASALASGAQTGLNYPICVGPCPSVPSTLVNSDGKFPKFAARTDCNSGTAPNQYCSLAEEQQNYATWKKFHSNRMDVAKTGIGYAFQDVNGGLRLGWAKISDLDGGPTSLGTNASGVSALVQTNKSAFYTWLYSISPYSDTPLRESLISAGKYFSRADNLGPWANTPDPTSKGLSTLSTTTTDTTAVRASHASCRRSYAMMLTDGYYNATDPGKDDADYPGSAVTITGSKPTGEALTFTYNNTQKPYAAASNYGNLADIAMKYWLTDLRSDLTNNVPTSLINPSFWQNMGFYGVTLGIDGTLTQDQATYDQLAAGTLAWPEAPSAGNSPKAIDDMWHATINGRGRLLNARNADVLADGIEGMLAEINSIESSQSGVAASTLSLTTTTKKYTPNYTTGTWVGNVIATNLEPKSGAELCTLWRVSGAWLTDPSDTSKKHWYVGGKVDGTPDLAPCTGSPSSYSGVYSSSTRKIYAWNGSSYGNFDSSNTYVTSNTTGVASGKNATGDTNLVNFLRGDQSLEDISDARGVVTTAKSYRSRPFVLGDIVNSTPTFIKGALDSSYDKLPTGTYGQASYRSYVTAKAARTGMLFAGANDGMLHGFGEADGVETFAFVPRAVMPNMHQLASRSYNHRYYVDGPTVEADACLPSASSCTTWKNILLGTAGVGGKTVFAIDVSDTSTMDASKIKWEILSTQSGFGNLGHITAEVQTGLAMNGKWVAVFGNGYNGGTGGVASLFVVDIDTGALIKEIVVSNSIPASGGDNGLGGVRLLKDANQKIIAAYAGDLKGNLWKFDLSNSSETSWAVALSGAPLYKTASTTLPGSQSITAAPAVVKHPLNGYVVAFGTGKMLESGDVSSTSTQTLYGVWDSITPAAITQIDKTNLVQQTITTGLTGSLVITNANGTTTTVAQTYYAVSTNPVNWTTNTSTPRGWYINLPNTGQRVIYPLETLTGTYGAVDTVSPNNVVTNPCLSSGSGKAWNYVIDLATGAGPTESIFTNNGGIATSNGYVSGYENSADGRTRYIKNDTLSTSTSTAYTPLSTQQLPTFSISCKLAKTCATASTVKRTWRQLIMR